MYFTHDFKITLTMLAQNNYISNKWLLSLLQDVAEMHSASIGFGVTDLDQTGHTWALLNWKVKIISRPKYGDTITVKTWARNHTKLYCYRDFEILNSKGKTIAIITSKWVLIDIFTRRISKIEDELVSKYHPEEKSIFNIVELDKPNEPENYTNSVDFSIRKSDIDINGHVNNLFYMDIALEAFPGDANKFNSYNEFEIMYKHQIRLDDKVTAYYSYENNENYVAIKSNNNQTLHSIIKFY